jgi:FixJ family two-component response regulator
MVREMTASTTVHVIDDDPDIRETIENLARSVGLSARSYASAQDFLGNYAGDRPGCIVLDLRMPGMSGIEAQARFAEQGINLPVIILTGYGDVPTAVRGLKGGAVDFIEKPFNNQLLLERIQACIAEDASRLRNDRASQEIAGRFATLSQREREILELVVAGKTSKEIARALGISAKTVDVHRGNVMRKVGASSVAELVRLAVTIARSGVTSQ